MKPLVVVFDIDTVLADFRESFKQLALSLGKPEDVYIGLEPPAWNDVTHEWEMGDLTGDHDTWRTIVTTRRFWSNMVSAVKVDTWLRIRDLAYIKNVRLYFVSNRVGVDCKEQTQRWLAMRGIPNPTVIISALKGEACRVVGADFHIDDKAGNAVHVSYHSRSTRSYLLDLPKNQFDRNVIGGKVIRVKSVDEFLDNVFRSIE